MRFSVGAILDTVVSDAGTVALHRALCALADDLNASLLHYEVTLEHFAGGDYLWFERCSVSADAILEDIEHMEDIMEAG